MAREELITILMLDVVGSTSMWELDGSTASSAITRLESLVAEIADRNGGIVHKSRGEGDSFFLTFENPAKAIEGAADLYRRIHLEPWPTREPIRARMAIRTGSCERRDGDLFGPTVNRCARMRAAADPSQIVVCDATHALTSTSVLPNIEYVDLGSYKLRDAPIAERFYGLALDGEMPVSTRLALNETELHNLPIRPTSFFGRANELDMVEANLRSSRLVTLTGPGGSGKTRLSEEVADRFVGDFVDGVWFIALADCPSVELVASVVSKAIPTIRVSEPTWDSVLAVLRERRMLIVLDNCEHLAPDLTPFAHRIVLECPRIQILATSRKPFNLTEEVVVPVPPFTVEGLEVDDEIEDEPAFALFVSRAKSKNAALNLGPASKHAIIAICQRLSGIPLAIEQAASYAGRLSPTQIEERLRGKIGLLKAAPGTVESRHETMRATIEWSIDLLSAEARELVFQLAVFSGGWTLEAAEAVAGSEIDAFEAHGELVDSSLIYWVDDETTGRRFRFLEPIKEFVVEADLAKAEARSRFLDWCLGFAEQVDMEMVGGNQAEWIRRAENELENFRTALATMWEKKDDRLPRLANFLKRLWLRLGLYREGAMWIENALSIESSSEPRLRATLLNALGACLSSFGEKNKAVENYECSLQIWRELDDKAQMAAVSNNLAILAADQKLFAEAQQLYSQSAELFSAIADFRGLGIALVNASYMEILLGNWIHACSISTKAIEILRECGDTRNLAYALGNYAHALWERGMKSEFRSVMEDQLGAVGTLHDPLPLGLAIMSLAVNGAELPNRDVARRALDILANLTGFEESGLSFESQERLARARSLLGRSRDTESVEPIDFADGLRLATRLLDEFCSAIEHNSN